MNYWISALRTEARQLVPIARQAEELGYAGVAVVDHVAMPERIDSPYPGGVPPWSVGTDWPDPWVAIGAMAGATSRIRFVTNVYVLPLRHPLLTAKAVATAAALSGERVILGVGVGWMAEEFAALAEDFRTRGRRTDEILALLRALWRGEMVEHHGRFYDFLRLQLRPAPERPVPVWIGGETEAALRRAARLGDGWISGRTLADAQALVPRLRALLREAGRAEAPFEVTVSATAPPTPDDLARLAELGVDNLKVQPWFYYGGDPSRLDTKLEAMARFREQVD
jgi:probable F420-dependent oxidoreductase